MANDKKEKISTAKKRIGNTILQRAKKEKNDEFYTQYQDIQAEVNSYIDYNPAVFKNKTILLPCDDPEWSEFTRFFAANFVNYGIKKLISTSFAPMAKRQYYEKLSEKQLSLFLTPYEKQSPNFNEIKSNCRGKVFILENTGNLDDTFDMDNLKWDYLNNTGDFRSEEVIKLRDEADIIITNPPFSLFREFLEWIEPKKKKFLILGSMNAITNKDMFPLIFDNILWTGTKNGAKEYIKPNNEGFQKMGNTYWFTNLDHGKRHEFMQLMTGEDNLRFNKKLISHSKLYPNEVYHKYDNYDAIEVPLIKAIPSDYDGIMGVPISFLEYYNPEQFEIIWQASGNTRACAPKEVLKRLSYQKNTEDRGGCALLNGQRKNSRILIQRRK